MGDVAAVELQEVSRVFPDGTVGVNKVSVTFTSGNIIALLGPSGCGKTTTLRLINRLEEASEGKVLVRGKNVADQRPEELRRSIGYVIQEGGLFPHLNVSTNVATVPRLLKWEPTRINERVREVLSLVGLPEEKFGRRMPSELSGGQRQRVGVARGLAADPDILLMDEPFGALDPGTRSSIQDEFLHLQETLKKTVIMVTHDITEAGKMANDIILMHKGEIIQMGELRELLLTPANDHVRDFLGKQGHGLALESLQVRGSLADLSSVSNGEPAMQIAEKTTLGQSLIRLAELSEDASVQIIESGIEYNAKAMRERILEDLRQAEQAFLRSESSVT